MDQNQKIDNANPMGPQVEKHKYVFPNFMAKMMKNVSMQVQFESSLMASALILVGLLFMAGFMMFFGDQTLIYKIILAINLIGGFLFMGSSMVTTYQQYGSYMDVMDFQNSMGMSQPGAKPVKKYNRKNQALFFGGLILFIAGFFIPTIITENIASMAKFEYYILGVMLLVGVLLMIAAVKKPKTLSSQPKQKVIAKQILKSPMAISNNKLVMRNPTSPALSVQKQVIQSKGTVPTLLKPTFSQSRPVQRPSPQIISNKPTASPSLKPTFSQRPAPVPIQRTVPVPMQRPVAVAAQPKPIVQAQRPTPVQVQQPRPAPVQAQRPVPMQRPIQQQTQQPRPVQRPIQEQPRPVQRQQIPVQRPIPAARPIQEQPRPVQQQRPIFRQQAPVQQQRSAQQPMKAPPQFVPTEQTSTAVSEEPKKLGFFAKLKEKISRKRNVNQNNNTNNVKSKPVNKKEQDMMNKIEQSLNKQLYDVNYMKDKERRY